MRLGTAICIVIALSTAARADAPIRLVPQVSRTSGFGRVAEHGRYAVRWHGETLTLWDHDSGILLGEQPRPPRTRVDCAISPDGRYLAFDGITEIVVQELDTGALRRIGPMPAELTGVWFSRDGTRVFAAHAKDAFRGSHDHAVSAWSFASGAKLSELATPSPRGVLLGHRGFVAGVTPDELYRPGIDAIARLDMAAGKLVEQIALPAELHGATRLAISADGRRAVTRHVRSRGGKRDGVLAYWDWPRRRILSTTPLFAPRPPWLSAAGGDDLAIAPDGSSVVVRVPKAGVRLYRFGATAPIAELPGELDLLAYGTDPARVVIGTGVYSAATGAVVVPPIPVLGSYDTSVAVHGTTVFVSRGRSVSAWDLQALRRRWTRRDGVPGGDARSIEVSPDGARLRVTTRSRVLAFDAANGATLADAARSIELRPDELDALEHSPDGAWSVAIRSGSRTGELRERATGRVVRTFQLARDPAVGTELVRWTAPGFITSASGALQLWKVDAAGPVATHVIDDAPGLEHAGVKLAVSPDGKTVGVVRADRTVRLFDAATGAPVRALPITDLGYAWRLAISGDRTWAAIVVDGTPIALNLARRVAVRLIEHGDQWVIADRDGVFTASAGAGRLLAAVRGRRGFRIDQLALRNNDPARLMRALGVGGDEARAYYERAYRTRLQRAGVQAAPVGDVFEAIPEARFRRVTRDGDHVELELELAAARGLARYHVDVDGVPVFGVAGRPASGKRQTVKLRVALGRGLNRIELRVIDAAGVEGLRPVHLVDGPASGPTPDLYFLGFGISDYANPAYRLAFASKDVIDLAAALQHARTRFANVHTQVYVDAAVTVDQIRAAKRFVARAGVDDLVVVMIAGHGVHASDAAAGYYFVTHATELARLAETAAPFELIEGLVDGIASRNKLFLMDTCESGERDPAARATAIARAGSRGLVARALRRVEGTARPAPRRYLLERDNFLFNGILRGSGTVVFSSSRGSELSYETDELGNGVFTQAVLEALTGDAADGDRDGRLAIPELRGYVARRVAEYTGGAQNPTIDRDNLAAELALPVLAAARPIAVRGTAEPAPYVVSAAPAAPAAPRPAARSPRGCGCRTDHGAGLGALVALVGCAALGRRRRRRA